MQTIAIVPAAGRSQRMGQPKLLLPWAGSTVIEHVVRVWRASRADRVLVVVHPQDERLAKLAKAAGAEVLRPASPPHEMKASVMVALDFAHAFQPRPTDAWLLAPADMPGLSSASIDAVIGAYEAGLRRHGGGARIVAAACRGRRGHPVLFPWSLAAEVPRLAAHEGLNSLVARHVVELVEAGDHATFDDLDTPEDFARLRARYQQ